MNLDPFYFVAGGFVFTLAWFKLNLLNEEQSFRLILVISVVLFLAGLVLHFTEFGRHSASGALLNPIVSLGLFRLCRRIFLRRLKREPRDTFLDWSPGMGADQLFNVVYFALGILLWILIPLGAERLAKAGW
jgi:O-antigen/teichoic acid export membrane protein